MTSAAAMFRNQYLITQSTNAPVSFAEVAPAIFGEWNVYCFAPLQIAHAGRNGIEALLIGVAVDPQRPRLGLQGVLDAILEQRSFTVDALAAKIEGLTGRFVFVARVSGEVYVWGDACHLRQILFGTIGKFRYVGSSEKLILAHARAELAMNRDKVRFMASPLFRRNEDAWVGDQAHDDRLSRLLPNHRLALSTMKATRQSFGYCRPSDINDGAIVELATSTLQGVYLALADSHTIVQPLTAGWDSRLLLAASLPVKRSISYYIFERHKEVGTINDSQVAQVLQQRLGLNFERIVPATVTPAFMTAIAAEQFFPRVLPKTANIQHHFHRADRDRVININGNGAEIARCYYGLTSGTPSFSRICHYLGYSPSDPFVSSALSPWHEDAKCAEMSSGVSVSDLLYWEQRMGNWGAMTPFEQDIACEEISPFNNKRLLLALLTLPARQRCAPDYPVFMRLLNAMSPLAASVPINPHVPRYKKYISRSGTATYLGKLAKHVVVQWCNLKA